MLLSMYGIYVLKNFLSLEKLFVVLKNFFTRSVMNASQLVLYFCLEKLILLGQLSMIHSLYGNSVLKKFGSFICFSNCSTYLSYALLTGPLEDVVALEFSPAATSPFSTFTFSS